MYYFFTSKTIVGIGRIIESQYAVVHEHWKKKVNHFGMIFYES